MPRMTQPPTPRRPVTPRGPEPRHRLRLGLAALGVLVVGAVAFAAPVSTLARAAVISPVAVFPAEGSRVASERTQITFRGVPISQLGTVTVTGHHSGRHTGHLVSHSDNNGGSFILDHPLAGGERVTVTAGVPLLNGKGDAYSFVTAKPAPSPPLTPGRPAARMRHDVMFFHSRKDLQPPSVQILRNSSAAAPGDIFVGPQNGPIQNGPMIVAPNGGLVWFAPNPHNTTSTDIRVQTYAGQPVLTWWQGKVANGVGFGIDQIYDTSYRRVAYVRAGNGLRADLHEFQLTGNGTALITAYQPVYWDARSGHGSVNQVVLDGVVQEIDIKTGLVLFQWDSLDHVPVSDTYANRPTSAGAWYDYFHLNSVAEAADGNLIVSGRNVSAGYEVDRRSGATVWTLGGRHSSFTISSADRFAFQHEIRMRSPTEVTVFDNGAGDTKVHRQSRGLILQVDFAHRTAHVAGAFEHTPMLLSSFEGNIDPLSNGDWFLGWGQFRYFTEYSPSGTVLFDARFGDTNSSYRAFRMPWQAQPRTRPAIIASTHGSRSTVYASWNGATTVARWRVLAGTKASSLSPVTTIASQGFESRATIPAANYVAVQPLNVSGQVLGDSLTVRAR